MAEINSEGIRQSGGSRQEPLTEDFIDNLDTAKAMARMRGMQYMAVDCNGEIWAYAYEPHLDEDEIWQPSDHTDSHEPKQMVFIANTNKPEDAEEMLHEF